MKQDTELYQYLRNLQYYIEAQRKKIKTLESRIEALESDTAMLKERKPINIEYKFDQLKVETLEGTLNIGLSPNESGSIGEYAVGGNVKEDVTLPIENNFANLKGKIRHGVINYLNKDAYLDADKIAKKYNYELDESYRELIIEDIRKQVDGRIQLYLNKSGKDIKDENAKNELGETIMKKLIQDVQIAIETFISHLPRKEDDN